MEKRAINFQIKGIRRDLSVSKADHNYAYDILNMRLTPNSGENMLSLINEKGNSKVLLTADNETPFSFGSCQYIGHCVINEYLVLFLIESEYCRIYRVNFKDSVIINNKEYYKIKKIFETHTYNSLNFNPNYPIETIGDFETEDIIKVYFTDGLNQPRVINILKDYYHDNLPLGVPPYNADELNFVRTIKADRNAQITIVKQESAGAMFSAGVIQYYFTYFDMHGQESNIFYASPLYYIADGNRGNSPEETSVGNAFRIKFENLDQDFEYVRIYSLRRTSLNGTPIVKRVMDIAINKDNNPAPVYFTDNNTNGEEIDPTVLYYLGGEPISASTFEDKDGTLFLGNLRLLRGLPNFDVDNSPIKTNATIQIGFIQDLKDIAVNTGVDPSITGATYNYQPMLDKSSKDITVFKTNEWYRLGFQLQHSSGVWTDAYWLGDIQMTTKPTSSITSTHFPVFYASLSEIDFSSLTDLGYTTIRPVIVYPKFSDRTILCQGMVNPTVYNIKDRYDNTIYAQASWFARPMFKPSNYLNSLTNTSWVEFRHNYMLHPSSCLSNEIQSMDGFNGHTALTKQNCPFWENGNSSSGYSDLYTDYYFVDCSVVTLNTPELDFDESFILRDDGQYKFKITGAIPINTTSSDINILASAPFEGDTAPVLTSNSGSYIYIKLGAINKKFSLTGGEGWLHSPCTVQWVDRKVEDCRIENVGYNNDEYDYTISGVYISPWHKSGQFMTSPKKGTIMEKHLSYLEPQYEASKLRQKKLSHLQFSYNTYYLASPWSVSGNTPITTYRSSEPTAERIRVPEFAFGRYYGNIDKVLTHGTHNNGTYSIYVSENDYIFKARQSFPEDINDVLIYSGHHPESYEALLNGSPITYDDSLYKTSDLINIRYKSTPHLVISLNPTAVPSDDLNFPTKTILPRLGGTPDYYQYVDDYSQELETIDFGELSTQIGGYLWLGEIWNEGVDVNTRFGGQTKEALISNDWVIGGDAKPLDSTSTLIWDRGDTYYQRYDCLKTYPFTLEDENSIVEVVSFMCETRVNIDGRYDRNRGTASLVAHPTNFNLMNPAYSQKDDYFTYRGYNSLNNVERFPNQITWTSTKQPNAIVDKWTNTNLVATLNLDGSKGQIRKLEKFRNDIFSFQDNGVSRIMFNDRTVLSTTSGAPIEVANSARVEGKLYITESEGLTNSKSIKVTPYGVYFIDGNTKTVYLFNGQQCLPLSDSKYMKTFFAGEPDDFNIFYDEIHKDVYFVNGTKCLCFSESFGEFVGFFNYENTPMMTNVTDKFITFYDSKLWEQGAGEYNSLYDTIRPHYITFVGADGLYADKIFTNLDWVADSFLGDTYAAKKTFDKLKVWNEYQTSEISLVDTLGFPSNLKKKFRIWRANVPRANWNGRDRIRNPWCFIKLSMNNPGHYKTTLHQTSLVYYV